MRVIIIGSMRKTEKEKAIVKRPDGTADREALVKNARRDLDEAGLDNLVKLTKALKKARKK